MFSCLSWGACSFFFVFFFCGALIKVLTVSEFYPSNIADENFYAGLADPQHVLEVTAARPAVVSDDTHAHTHADSHTYALLFCFSVADTNAFLP